MSGEPLLWLRTELLGSRLGAEEPLPEAIRWIEIDEALLRGGGRLAPGETTLPPSWVGRLLRWRIAGLRPLLATATAPEGLDRDTVRAAALEIDALTGATLDAIRIVPPAPIEAKARPAPPAEVPAIPEAMLRRSAAALWGLAVGDSLGAPVENLPAEKIARLYGPFRDFVSGRGWGPGSPTRETVFALLWLRDLSRGRTVHTAEDRARLGRALARWVVGRPRDFGHLTREILRGYLEEPPVCAARRFWDRAGPMTEFNAALSRAAAVGIALPADADLRAASAISATAMTHVAPVCVASGMAVAEAVAAAVRGEEPLVAARASVWEARTEQALADLESGWSPGGAGWSGSGRSHPLKTLQSALWAFRQERPAEEVLLDLVRRGGDADTHAAIAGALLAARDGEEALPARWRGSLQVGSLLAAVVRRFEETSGGKGPKAS